MRKPRPTARLQFAFLTLTLSLSLAAGACQDESNLIGPRNEMEVFNGTDTFQWQVTALSNVTQKLTYNWDNSGPTADVNQSSSLGSGSATLTVMDGEGMEVYSRSLSENGTFGTSSGSPGSWTITIVLTKATGTLNFRLQKP